MKTHTVCLGLGTNLGDKEANLHAAVAEIEKRIGKVVSLSAFYATAPWGFDSPHTFLNAACAVDTLFSPLEVLHITQSIEKDLGRLKKSVDGQYSDRLMDVDVLLYDDLVIHTPELVIPHPLMHQRKFVMEPLAEIAPDLVHPVLQKSMQELLAEICS
ncbi:MAG: 2-amino-4-hydroxy-6-hydroxymethyldihydropteridine diphosphokinase [Bacteroidaceae bacterium]|nr:2-amino-4-hydroxy-6-hydroxymethyldihydropteridine diphosphokinase [Bacteroidaceae bacterium]